MTESEAHRREVKNTFSTLNKIYPCFERAQLAVFDELVSSGKLDFAKAYADQVCIVYPEIGYNMQYDLLCEQSVEKQDTLTATAESASKTTSSSAAADQEKLALLNKWVSTCPNSVHALRSRAGLYEEMQKQKESEKDEDKADQLEQEQEQQFKQMFQIDTEVSLNEYFADEDEKDEDGEYEDEDFDD